MKRKYAMVEFRRTSFDISMQAHVPMAFRSFFLTLDDMQAGMAQFFFYRREDEFLWTYGGSQAILPMAMSMNLFAFAVDGVESRPIKRDDADWLAAEILQYLPVEVVEKTIRPLLDKAVLEGEQE